MNPPDPVSAAGDDRAMAELNRWLLAQDAEQRIAWALQTLAGNHVLSSSFGAQSAVSLHLATRQRPDMPVILVDTGYLFPETYGFVDALSERLALNLKVVRPTLSPSWLEARHGRLWENGSAGLERYNRLVKVEPMQRALDELGARTWLSGLRHGQSQSRADAQVLELRWGRWKLHPIVDWSDRDVGQYLARHNLPYHPLWHQGYVSIGDVPTTRQWQPGMREEDTRFFGIKRECGIHADR
ncbi:MAG: phosphoadenosine phosphosulfate reductase [Gammaproteobacteria bacterium HGW-Gammaproteobacteria-5]|jgi:phosphoadenosine phosphosulfate reductase|nr:MAG: phosphoadenosine phosphosulfate reductase [Gammaproteobacteria bacterium HGW-Gammaproteobacteria-5]